MSSEEITEGNALDLSHGFFHEVVKPAMATVCPELLEQAACGRFGLGSECLGLDDAASRDHQWGGSCRHPAARAGLGNGSARPRNRPQRDLVGAPHRIAPGVLGGCVAMNEKKFDPTS